MAAVGAHVDLHGGARARPRGLHLVQASQAAARLGIDRTTMIGLLDSLERKDLVARRPDAGDRGRNVVVLTESGQTTLRVATEARDAAQRELPAQLDEHEPAWLRALLTRLTSGRART